MAQSFDHAPSPFVNETLPKRHKPNVQCSSCMLEEAVVNGLCATCVTALPSIPTTILGPVGIIATCPLPGCVNNAKPGKFCTPELMDEAHKGKSGQWVCSVVGCLEKAREKKKDGRCTQHGGGKRCSEAGCNSFARPPTDQCKKHGGGHRCEEPGCVKAARDSTKFCAKHGGGRRCTEQGCTKFAMGDMSKCISHGGGNRCIYPGCAKSARSVGNTGLCKRHGGGKRCYAPECEKSAQDPTDFCKAHGGGQRRCTFSPECGKAVCVDDVASGLCDAHHRLQVLTPGASIDVGPISVPPATEAASSHVFSQMTVVPPTPLVAPPLGYPHIEGFVPLAPPPPIAPPPPEVDVIAIAAAMIPPHHSSPVSLASSKVMAGAEALVPAQPDAPSAPPPSLWGGSHLLALLDASAGPPMGDGTASPSGSGDVPSRFTSYTV